MEWNETSIKDRADKLFEIASKVWSLPEEYNFPSTTGKKFDYEIEYNLFDGINFTGETPRKVIIGGMD